MNLPPQNSVKIEDLNVEYERFFSFSLDLLCISSYDGHFKKVNPAFERTLGFSADEMCARSYLEFIHPDDIEITMKEVEKQLLNKQEVLSFENRYRHKNGTYRWLSWKSAPVGEFMYAVARDVTESKKANAELVETKERLETVNGELESFSYSAAHDLRAPVRSILAFGDLLRKDPETRLGAEGLTHLERVIASAKKMGVLIDALLNLSRLARTEVIRADFDLSKLAEECLNELRQTEPARRVRTTVTPGLLVNGDAALLKSALGNLFENAWKYSAKTPDAAIEFGCSRKATQSPVYYVRDNGAGFDMKYSDKLFGVFERLHSEREFAGTGIGLATVQRIIQRHGGRIWAEASPQKGATFYFSL